MAFNQTFNNVKTVKNFDDSNSSKDISGFNQTYNDVIEVINAQYDSKTLDTINPLVKKILDMDEIQAEKLYEIIKSNNSGIGSSDYNRLKTILSDKKNKKDAILEYIKTGTVSLAFANALLAIIKTFLGL